MSKSQEVYREDLLYCAGCQTTYIREDQHPFLRGRYEGNVSDGYCLSDRINATIIQLAAMKTNPKVLRNIGEHLMEKIEKLNQIRRDKELPEYTLQEWMNHSRYNEGRPGIPVNPNHYIEMLKEYVFPGEETKTELP